VHEDWLAWLPEAKDHLYAFTNQELDVSYATLSVTLDDAFTLCQHGLFHPARDQAANFEDLFDRLACGLRGVLRALYEHGRQFGTLPNFAPLRSDYFRSERARQIARSNNSFSFLILRSRKRFFRKLGAVEQIVADLHKQCRHLTQEIAQTTALHVHKEWRRLEILHYDLNTCLCETKVMLKSFFCVLPCDEVTEFRKQLLMVPAPGPTTQPRLTNLVRTARQFATQRALAGGGDSASRNVPLQSQVYHSRDNSGSEDGIPSTRMRPDGTGGSNETN